VSENGVIAAVVDTKPNLNKDTYKHPESFATLDAMAENEVTALIGPFWADAQLEVNVSTVIITLI